MSTIILIVSIIGCLAAVVSITLPIISTVLTKRKMNLIRHADDFYVKDEESNKIFNRIKNCDNSSIIAASFLSLIVSSSVLIHVLINEGEKYSDELQRNNYRNSLTPKVISRINELEGNYE